MPKPNALHHLAISTANIKAQIEYFTDVLGMELVALYWMHGVKGAWHGFLKLGDTCSVAFVQMDKIKEIEPAWGVSHAGNPGLPSAAGTMQHVAFNVETEAELLAMRDRIRSRGINVFGPLNHGFCKSIYFAGLEGLCLEIATSSEAIDARAWIDPEVVALAGISPDELRRFTAPASYDGKGGAVAQPPIDPAKPHMRYADQEQYRKLMTTPDEEITRKMSEPTPPVMVPKADKAA
jgi:catechol 2,3-dioxygenase-like lactoylglutathione lyase family enzyme